MQKFVPFPIFLFLALYLFSSSLLAQNKALHLFIFPYLPAGKIIKHNKEFKSYLIRKLQHPISIISARSIPKYIENIKKLDYDLILTPSHIGRFAQVDKGYQPIAVTQNSIQACFVVKKGSPIKKLSDAKHKILSMAPSFALLHNTALKKLKESGLTLHENIQYIQTKGHHNALRTLIQGKSDIAVFGMNLWRKLPKQKKDLLRIVDKPEKVPGFILLGSKDLTPLFIKRIKKAILNFRTSDQAKKYLFKGFKPISEKTLKELDIYTKILH